MLFEKPKWVKHERRGRYVEQCPLFSVDIDSTGQRLATAANDNKVRIWAMGPILDAQKEEDPNVPKLLATLTDHFEPVNVARFSPKGNLIASGSDSKLVVINHLMPGPASVRFGDKDAPSLENWKQMHVLRGHKSNVCDISWSPDGRRVASASLDNLVFIWDVASGRQVTVLEGHHGYVKGVAWDPFNMYIATQGENDGIFIWRVSDWSCVAKVKTQFSTSADNSMHSRLSWSPDGQNIVGTCMVDKSTNTYLAPIIRRTSWDSIKQFTGHKLTVSVAKFNPCHFYPRKEPGSDAATTLCALGSYDTQVTLWSSSEATPVMQLTHMFKRRAVMDLAWMPDGMSMVACSVDGTIAALQFNEQDLGKKVPQHEVKSLLHSLYGDLQVRHQTPLADPELLKLQGPGNGNQDTGDRQGQQVLASRPANRAAPGDANMGKLSSRMGPAGGVTEAGFAPPPAQAPTTTNIAAGSSAGAAGPSNQPLPRPTVTMEGGRKRIAPMPVGETAHAQHAAHASQPPWGPGATSQHPQGSVPSPPPVHRQQQLKQPQPQIQAGTGAGGSAAFVGSGSVIGGRGLDNGVPAAKRQALQASGAPYPHMQPLISGGGAVLGGVEGGGAPVMTNLVLPPPPLLSLLHVHLGNWPGEEGGPAGVAVSLEAANTAKDHRGRPASRLQCSRGGSILWHDSVQGCVVQAAGGLHFSAISTSGGDLLLFSPAGRRMLPPIQLGCSAVVMAVRGWRLMVLSTDGRVRVWDVAQGRLLLEADAGPLLRGPAAADGSVLNAGLTQTGIPLLIMKNHHAYSYNEGWACWMRVADDAFPASHFHSTFSSNQGILSSVQAAVAGARQPRDVLAAANQPPHIQNRATRAHLECNVASALVMQSQQEWRRWLQTYVRQLAGDEDEARLKEIINDLLGPMRWSPATHGGASAPGKGWEPKVLDLDKRQILRYDVLREVSRVRSPSMQSLATQSLEALKEAEATVAAAEAERKQREASAAPASAMPVSPASGLGTTDLQMSGDGLQGEGFGSQLALS